MFPPCYSRALHVDESAAVNRLLLLLSLLALTGCVRTGPGADLDEYLVRLERVLEQGSHQVIEKDFPRLPSVRDLRLEPAEENFDILEFLRIGRCELQHLVAERNSNLGRLAQPSQRLVYEINFLRLGDECRDAIAEDYPELANDLSRVLEIKRENLAAAVWQATLGGEEFRSYWLPGSAPLPERFDENAELLFALQQLDADVKRWMGGDLTIDSARLERQLDLIRRGNGGQQLLAWSMIRNTLDTASGVVSDRLERQPLCFEDMQTPKASILDNVVRKYFVGGVQAWAAGLDSRYYETHPVLRSLEVTLEDTQPAAFVSWRADRDAFLGDARAALSRHVDALRPLLEQCNILPGTD